MREATALIFDEFAVAYRRGEAPDVVAYLERAGDEADVLADAIDRFLVAVPAREPSEEEAVRLQARIAGEPPLLRMRVRRALTRDAVVDALVQRLDLDPATRDKVGRYYHRLETGGLDPAPVSARVWEVLSALLSASAPRLADFSPRRVEVAEAYLRMQDAPELAASPGALLEPVATAPDEPDEVDRLFTGTS